MAENSDGHRQPSTLQGPPSPGQELKLASEAMQRAADAMIAATESFRTQFRAREQLTARPATYHADVPETPSAATPTSQRRSTGSSRYDRSESNSPILWLRFLDSTPQEAPPGSVQPGKPAHQQPLSQGPAAPLLFSGSSTEVGSPSSAGNWPKAAGSGGTASPVTPRVPKAPAPVVSIGPGWRQSGLAAAPSGLHMDLVDAAHLFRASQRQVHDAPSQPEPRRSSATYELHRARAKVATNRSRQEDPGSRPRVFAGKIDEILFVLVICMGQLVMLAAMAQALVPAQIIGQSFPDTNPGKLAWYSAAYGLTAGTFVLPSGRLGDVFGHKIIFVLGFLWLALWSFVIGFAPTVQSSGGQGTVYFCFCRAMQGIGSALLVPNGQAMMGMAYSPGPRKNIVMCLFGAAAPLGFVVGAAMSSLFADQAQWPWAFWTMAAFCVALAALGVLVLPSPHWYLVLNDKQVEHGLWTRLDAPGILLGVSGLVLVNFAVNQAPIAAWTTPYTYFILIIGLILLAAFIYTQRHARYPLLPLAAMRASTNFVLGCTAAGWGCFGVWIFYSVALLEALRGWSPLMVSAALAPGPITGLIASLLTGFLMSRGVRAHWIMLVSMLSFLAGSLLFATAPVSQSYWLNTFFGILIMPFGMDMSNPAATILLSNSVSKEHQGVAASLVVTVVNYSISLALGVAGTIQMQMDSSEQITLAGCRAAQYFGIGLGGLGVTLAMASLLGSYVCVTVSTRN